MKKILALNYEQQQSFFEVAFVFVFVFVLGVVVLFVVLQHVVLSVVAVIGVLQQVGTFTGVVFNVFVGHFVFFAQR